MNSASLETYHERMKDIQDVSETIAVANHQLNKLLQKFGWSRSHLKDDGMVKRISLVLILYTFENLNELNADRLEDLGKDWIK